MFGAGKVGKTSSSVVPVFRRLARHFRSHHGILGSFLYLQTVEKSPDSGTHSKSAFRTLTASPQKAGQDMDLQGHLLGTLLGCTQTVLLQKALDRTTSLTDPTPNLNFGIPSRFVRKKLVQQCGSQHIFYSQMSRLPHSTPEESG